MTKRVKKATSKKNPDQGGLALPESAALGFHKALNRFEKRNAAIGSEAAAEHITVMRQTLRTFETLGNLGILSPVIKANVSDIPTVVDAAPAEARLLKDMKRTMNKLAVKHDAERPKPQVSHDPDPQWASRLDPNIIGRKRQDPPKYRNSSRGRSDQRPHR